LSKGEIFYELEKYDEAIRWYEKVLEKHPDDQSKYNQKAVALYQSKKFKEAIECTDESLVLKADNDE
jgi:tetratricopeptide (TPR) repeat protein